MDGAGDWAAERAGEGEEGSQGSVPGGEPIREKACADRGGAIGWVRVAWVKEEKGGSACSGCPVCATCSARAAGLMPYWTGCVVGMAAGDRAVSEAGVDVGLAGEAGAGVEYRAAGYAAPAAAQVWGEAGAGWAEGGAEAEDPGEEANGVGEPGEARWSPEACAGVSGAAGLTS